MHRVLSGGVGWVVGGGGGAGSGRAGQLQVRASTETAARIAAWHTRRAKRLRARAHLRIDDEALAAGRHDGLRGDEG